MTNYELKINDVTRVINWITSLSEYQTHAMETPSGKIDCVLNHTTDQQKKAFLVGIMERLFTFKIDNTEVTMFDYIRQLLGDHLFCSLISSQTKTNLGTSYVDVFPAIYEGVPMGIDTTGYSKVGVRILWNKNSGASRHDARLVNSSNTSQVLAHTEATGSGLATGVNTFMDINLPVEFQNFRGDVKLQAKAGNTTDDPIFDAIWIYLIR